MKNIATTISEATIHVRLADHQDPLKAVEWIDVRIAMDNAKMPSGTRLEGFEQHRLAGLRLVTLLHARNVLDAEIQRLQQVVNHRP